MTTITIQGDVKLPKTDFSSLPELRNVLNFLSIDFEEMPDKEVSNSLLKIREETERVDLNHFNYLSDESI